MGLGAEKQYENLVHATYFDYPDKRLESNGIFLRLRDLGDEYYITAKGR